MRRLRPHGAERPHRLPGVDAPQVNFTTQTLSLTLDEARLDQICRPEQYVTNLGPLFDRLAALT